MNWNIFKRKEKRTEVVQQTPVNEDILRILGTEFSFRKGFSAKSALAISSVFACVELISNAIATMDISVKSLTTKGKFEQIQLNRIFKKNNVTKFTLIKQMISDMLLYGNGFAFIERSTDGMIVGLTYLPGDQVTIYHNDQIGNPDLYFLYKGIKILPQDILHIYKNSYDGYCGVPIIKFANRSIYLSNSAEDAAADYFNSGLNINAIIHATSPMSGHQAKQAVESMQGIGFDNSAGTGKIKFLPFDLKLEPISQNAQEAQLTDTRLFNVQDIARYFNIPVSMLMENNKNTSEINLQFLTQTLSPYIVLLEDELNRKLISNDDLFFDLDERALLRTDLKSTADYYGALVDKGIMTRAEVRDALGLPVLEGTDKLIVPYTKIEDNVIDNTQENKSEKEETK